VASAANDGGHKVDKENPQRRRRSQREKAMMADMARNSYLFQDKRDIHIFICGQSNAEQSQ
jgi:hypothetical protein